MVFVITGSIPSKKNQLIAVVDRVDAFKFLNTLPATITKKDCVTALFKTFSRIKNAPAYEKWETETVEVLQNQLRSWQPAAERNGIVFPVPTATVVTKFYWTGKYRRDNSNKTEGLHDALVRANIIADDSYQVMPDTSQGARNYTEEIVKNMAVIYVTVPIP